MTTGREVEGDANLMPRCHESLAKSPAVWAAAHWFQRLGAARLGYDGHRPRETLCPSGWAVGKAGGNKKAWDTLL